MNILMSLSARHLRLNRKRTVITVVGIALSVAMVTAISGFIVSFQDLLYRDAVAREGMWHVRYSGLDQATAAAVAAEPVFAASTAEENEEGVALTLLFSKVDRRLFERSEEVCARHGIDIEQVRYHNNLLIAEGVIPSGYYEPLYTFAAILLSLVAIASVMVISNAFSISAGERSRQFGLLSSVGATRRQIRGIVLWEGAMLGCFAIPLGLVMGVVAQWVALSAANYILGAIDTVTFLVEFRVALSAWVLLLAVGMAFATIFLAAWLPARRAARQSAIDAIRQTAEVRVHPRDVRVSPLVPALFGFEGLLAAKTMRRSRRRYRTTVLSLVVSIVLFIGVSSFGQMLFKASSMVYEDYGSNVLVRIHAEDEARQTRLSRAIADIPNASVYPWRQLRGGLAEVGERWMTDSGREMLGAGEKNVYLYSLSDERFAALCRSLRLEPAALSDPGSPGAILVNTSGTYIRQGRRHNFTPYRDISGESVGLTLGEAEHSLSIAAQTGEIPTEISPFFSADGLNLVIPDSVRAVWQPENLAPYLSLTVMSPDPGAFEQRAVELLSGELSETEYTVINYEAAAESTRSISLLIMLFVYGFITMLSLISVTNVVTTISTGIALRRREFAMLRSMGMTGGDVLKSLRYESLIYGLKSLLYGIPLGLAASAAMYWALDGAMSFEYIWPVQSILISILAVLALTAATMWFAGNRQRREHITHALQNEIV